MSKVIVAALLTIPILISGWFYHVAKQHYSDNPAFRAIFANAVNVKIDLPRVKSETLSTQSHPQQFQWFRDTNQFNPAYLDCPWDGAITVTDADGTQHVLLYYRGALHCADVPRATAPTGTAIVTGQLATWIESLKLQPLKPNRRKLSPK